MTQKSILITGGAGFIGTNLTRQLLDLGNRVISLDNFYSSSPKNVEQFKKNKAYKFIKHDVRESIRIKEKIDEIYHLASPASPPIFQKKPIFTLNTSFLGIKNAIRLAEEKKAKLLFSSSSEVYGQALVHPQKEDYWGNVNPVGPRACYDEGKRISETYCWEKKNQGLDIRVVRIFNTYGPFMNPDDGRVVSNFICQALNNQPLTVYGDGTQTRSFCFVDDLIDGFLAFMELGQEYFGPINLGNSQETQIITLARKILELVPESKSKTVHKPLPADDPVKRKPDIGRAKGKLGWQPEVSLDEGIKRTIEYFREITCHSESRPSRPEAEDARP